MANQFEKSSINESDGVIDVALLQSLQDHFCRANHMYLTCVGRDDEVITQAYGSEEELAFVRGLVGEKGYLNLVHRMKANLVESMQEQPLESGYAKMYGVSTKNQEELEVIWIVVAVLREQIGAQDQIPECVMTTTEEDFYTSVEFLDAISRQLFDVKIHQMIAQEARDRSIRAEEEMERQLSRTRSMSEVLQRLESDEGFDKVVDGVMEETCRSLGIGGGGLLRLNTDGATATMISEYSSEEQLALRDKMTDLPVTELPFFNGRPYMISTDSMMPEEFALFMKAYHLTALIAQPLEVHHRYQMYICFYEFDGEREWQNEDVTFIGSVKRVVSSILSKRIAKNSLASSYASLEAILENAGCGIYVADYEKKSLLFTNQKFKTIFSHSIRAGKLTEILFSEQEVARTHYYQEIYYPEEERWLDVHKTMINWVDGREVYLSTLYDITDKKIYQKEIENQANNDFLTGLLNRMRCEQDLKRYILSAQIVDGEGALLYIDLDDFKHINDGLGHQYGDVLLKAISRSLQKIEGVENSCYRMGGDEFIIVVPDTMFAELSRIIAEVQTIFDKPWFLKGEDYYCTMSMGIVCFPTDGDTVEDVIRKADMTLLAAKRRGKNRIEYYNAKDELSAYQRLDLEKNMRQAAKDSCSEFEVYYQPIINMDAEGHPCCGAEALVRWNSSVMGFVRPDDFIPLAEYLGLINPIGEHVLIEAARRCRYWNDMGHPEYKVNVNLSVIQLLQNDIVKKIRRALNETRVNPQNLTLEVTESLAINDMERMKKILSEIRSLGVKVALDDFGTGYSSLNHIREMPLNVIKVDRCFVEHLGEDDFSNAFVRMVVELAKSIGVRVCAEGVETEQQLAVLESMNVSMIQGYYFGKPMKIEEFEARYL